MVLNINNKIQIEKKKIIDNFGAPFIKMQFLYKL